MKRTVISNACALAVLCGIPSAALATNYPDTTWDNWGPAENDIVSVDVTNDAASLTFKINLNSAADLSVNYYPNFEVGIQTNGGAGGQTAINGNYGLGDPAIGSGYGTPVGISTGMNFFIGAYLNGPDYSGGAELFGYSTTSGWNKIGFTAPIIEVATGTASVSFSFPLSDVGLAAGNTMNFDVWSTYSGANSAYDALQNPVKTFDGTADLPYPNGGNPPANYDSATANGSVISSRAYTIGSAGVTASWTGAASGAWSDAANWSGGVPNGVDHAATFDASAMGNPVVNVDSGKTLGSLTLAGATSYTLSGAGSITLDKSVGTVALNVTGGNHSVAVPVTLNDDAVVSVAASSQLSLTSTLSAAGRSVTKEGAGTAQFENVRAATLNVAAGSLVIHQKAVANSEPGTSKVNALTIAANASVDLKNNALVVDYVGGSLGTLLNDLRAHLLAGRLKTTAASNRTLGYLDNSASPRASFGGVSVDASSVLIGYAIAGDVDLDGTVNFNDLLVVAQNYGQGNRFWAAGDFDYSGDVAFNDLLLIAQNYGASGFVAGGDFAAEWTFARSIAPEPASLMVICAGASLTRRRR